MARSKGRAPRQSNKSGNYFVTMFQDEILIPLATVMARPRLFIKQLFALGLIVFTAFGIWNSLKVITGSESPVVVVLSGSMEPGFYRNDILFLWNRQAKFEAGDIAVYSIKGKEIPIVHRVLEVHEKEEGDVNILTKGDNNRIHDRGLYQEGDDFEKMWLNTEDILGTVVAYLPNLGMITIFLNSSWWVKGSLIGAMAFMVLSRKDDDGNELGKSIIKRDKDE